MALDIAKIAERLGELNKPRGNQGTGLDYLTLKDGRNRIRILPAMEGKDLFFEETFVHYGVGAHGDNKGQTVTCPTTKGEGAPCPVCDLVKQLRGMSKAKDDKLDKQARNLNRKKRVFFNAIDLSEDLDAYTKKEDGKWYFTNTKGEEEQKSPVKVLATGIGVLKDILGYIVDPEYGDITDPEKGLDVIITKTGTGLNTNYEVKTARKESAISFEEWEECLNDLSILSAIKSYDEISNVVEGKTADSTTPAKEEEEEEEDDDLPFKEGDSAEEDEMQAEIANAARRRTRR